MLQIGWVRPYLPADSTPNLARPPVSAAVSPAATSAWRDRYHAGPGTTPIWRLEPSRAVPILAAVCGAIEAAHRDGVLHRDLKPENILLPGGGVEAKVLDFGVAKMVAQDAAGDAPVERRDTLTMAGTIVGTPAYMAPEQLRADAPNPRTDVFALGVIAYEMLSGDLPFSRGSLTDVVLAGARPRAPHRAQSGRAAGSGPRDRPRVAVNPEDRPASPQAFAAEVARAMAAVTPSSLRRGA